MRVLVGCEYSGIVRDAFTAKGHDAWSCDLLPTESPGNHIQDDVLNHLDEKWDLAIFHPTCTYLTNAGVRHLHSVPSKNGVVTKVHGQARMLEMEKACDFFIKLWNCPIPKIAIENPIPHKYAKAFIGMYDQLVRPWMFGNPETKAICLWLKNLPKLKIDSSKFLFKADRKHLVHMCPPSKDRWKIRSRFFPEIAKAMAEQWG